MLIVQIVLLMQIVQTGTAMSETLQPQPHAQHQAKPQAPMDVTSTLDRMESDDIPMRSENIDESISTLERLHTELTRELNQARA